MSERGRYNHYISVQLRRMLEQQGLQFAFSGTRACCDKHVLHSAGMVFGASAHLIRTNVLG